MKLKHRPMIFIILMLTMVLGALGYANAGTINFTNDYLDVSFQERCSGVACGSSQWYFDTSGTPGVQGVYTNYFEHFAVWYGGAIKESEYGSHFSLVEAFQNSPDGRTATLRTGDLEVKRQIYVPPGHNPYFTMIYTLKNVGSSALSDIRFFESIDYDIGGADHDYGWYSAVTDTVWEDDTNYYKNGFGGNVPSSRHGMDYWFTQNYSDWDDGNLNNTNCYPSCDGSSTDDVAVGLQWNVGTMNPGAEWRLIVTWSFGEVSGGSMQANAGPSQTVNLGDVVSFDGSGSTCLGAACPIVSYDWDFGDSNTSSGEFVTHSYGAPGIFTVSLTVTGSDDSSSTHRTTVEVLAPLNNPPVADAGPDQTVEQDSLGGASVTLDGSASSDPDGDALSYSWSWSSGSASGVSPTVTLPLGTTTVTLTVSDGDLSDADTVDITVRDTTPPTIDAGPPSITVQTDPGLCTAQVTLGAVTSDTCDANPTVAWSHGPSAAFPLGSTEVTATATDDSGNSSSDLITVNVVDNQAPAISCNSPAAIVPPDAPISFRATAGDNCSVSETVITDYDCWFINPSGRRVDKTGSCVVQINGDTITIVDSGGVGDHISWTVTAVDGSGNTASQACEVVVQNPGRGGGRNR